MKKSLYCLLLVALISCKKDSLPERDYSDDPDFMIPVIPDTQYEVLGKPNMFKSQVNWIVKSKASSHIPLVLHVGDIVNFDSDKQWQFASSMMKVFDDKQLPYALAVGNHDTEIFMTDSKNIAPGDPNANLRKTTKFNNYFPVNRFTIQTTRYETDKSDNAVYMFKAGGKKWMVVTLEFCAREVAAQWADSILSAYPDYNAIVLTHYHLSPNGEIGSTTSRYGSMKVTDVFNNYLKPHANLLLVLSGHVCYSATRTDIGTNGNTIYSVLQDYQNTDSGGGYLRLLHINTQTGTISGEMFSPYYNKVLDSTRFSYSGVQFIN